MIDLRIDKKQLERTVERAKERNIIIPTFEQMKNPELIPDSVKEELKKIGLWDITSRNLFRITWKNDPVAKGGGYGGVNFIELPSSLTGVDARIVALVGKWFPTGAHKVGATFGCLVPPLITGQFDPTYHQAVWPSTGNYCRGGAYDAALLACESIAILPEGMSRERFEWLEKVAGEVIATPGSESNVKEIYDKVWELRGERDNVFVFNQFDEFGNYLWHYEITGHAMEEVLQQVMGPKDDYRGLCLTTGSAGTLYDGANHNMSRQTCVSNRFAIFLPSDVVRVRRSRLPCRLCFRDDSWVLKFKLPELTRRSELVYPENIRSLVQIPNEMLAKRLLD